MAKLPLGSQSDIFITLESGALKRPKDTVGAALPHTGIDFVGKPPNCVRAALPHTDSKVC